MGPQLSRSINGCSSSALRGTGCLHKVPRTKKFNWKEKQAAQWMKPADTILTPMIRVTSSDVWHHMPPEKAPHFCAMRAKAAEPQITRKTQTNPWNAARSTKRVTGSLPKGQGHGQWKVDGALRKSQRREDWEPPQRRAVGPGLDRGPEKGQGGRASENLRDSVL